MPIPGFCNDSIDIFDAINHLDMFFIIISNL